MNVVQVASSLTHFSYVQAAHVSQLRPALGHPSKESQLTALDHKERERYKQVLQLLSAHAAAHQVGHTHTRWATLTPGGPHPHRAWSL